MNSQCVHVCPFCDEQVIDDVDLAESPNQVQAVNEALDVHLSGHVDEIVDFVRRCR